MSDISEYEDCLGHIEHRDRLVFVFLPQPDLGIFGVIQLLSKDLSY